MWAHFRNSTRDSYNISCSRVTSWHMEPQCNIRDSIRLRPKADAQEYDMGHCQGKRLPIVPITMNTKIRKLQFEVCGHKVGLSASCSLCSLCSRFSVQYADFSEFGYGVAILSESKYGFSCIGNVLRISLLRAATAPDADQDQGITFMFFPSKFLMSLG